MRLINKNFCLLSLFLYLFLSTALVYAEGITIEHVSGRFKDSFYLIEANIKYELSDNVLEALSHGITLRFDMIVEIERERKWIWDKKITTAILSYQLQHLPLSNNYLVTNMITGERKQLQELNEAMQTLGTINDFPVVSETEFDPNRVYNFFMMSELRIRTLPLPLQPLALISPKWKLTSQWYEWTIR
jgi:hypothetical protein